MHKQSDKPPSEENKDKKQCTRNPSFKNRKPPEIKQTLTSKYRMLKANPLLKLSLDTNSLSSLPQSVTNLTGNSQISGIDLYNDLSAKQAATNGNSLSANKKYSSSKSKEISRKIVTDGKNIVDSNKQTLQTKQSTSVNKKLARSQSVKSSSSCDNNFKKPYSKPIPSVPSTSRVKNTLHIKQTNDNKLFSSHPSTSNDKKSIMNNIKQENTLKENDKSKKIVTKPLRRSLSAQHFDRKKGKTCNPKECVTRLNSSHSKSLENVQSERKVTLLTSTISPIAEEKTNVTFKTPSAYERRSVAFQTPNTSRKSVYLPHSQSPEVISKELHEKLIEWLSKRGQSLGNFHHLKCFGLQTLKEIDEENKENIEVMQDLGKGSYEDLRISSDFGTCNQEIIGGAEMNQKDLNMIAKDALCDLHKLILEGYPCNDCEGWLRLIHQKYKNVEEEPQYWECRAAIEQSRGNIGSAVECYKTAIVQGAEINSVDESLDQLLQKFSLLNINTDETGDKKVSRDRAKIIKDARNVFKSTIIQFAVRERTLKKNNTTNNNTEKKFLVTPVRRSTRRRSAYTSTPGVKMCTTLKDLDSSIKESMDFHANNALC